MSLAGKILAILNVLAAAGFVALAAMDYGKRQAWQLAVLQHDLVLHGLPIDEKELNAYGEPRAEQLTDSAVAPLFRPVGGGSPKTQKAEVQALRTNLQTKIDDASTKQSKGQKLAAVLLRFAPSAAERERFMDRRDNPRLKQPTEEEMQAELDKQFDQVLNSTADEETRKQLVATLLLRLAPVFQLEPAFREANESGSPDPLESPYYLRAVTVIGLERAVGTMEARAMAWKEMARECEQTVAREMAAFAGDHGERLQELQVLAREVEDAKGFLKNQQEVAEKYQVVINNRQAEIKDMQERLKQAVAAYQESLRQQTRTEQELFEALQRQHEAAVKNQEMERQIRKLESGL